MDGWVRDCGGNVGKMLAEKRTMFDGHGWRLPSASEFLPATLPIFCQRHKIKKGYHNDISVY